MTHANVTSLQNQQAALLNALFTHPSRDGARGAREHLLTQHATQGAQALRGLQAYQANGHALAERSLQAAYPVIEQMMGADNFALLARDFWHHHPPTRGDLAHWGDALPAFLASSDALSDTPYLADVARVEWALHRAASAADALADPTSFARLSAEDPQGLTLTLAPGTALVRSPYPAASLVLSHRRGVPSLKEAAQRLRDGVAETALVWRQGLQARTALVLPVDAALLDSLLKGLDLPTALDTALAADVNETQDFNFSTWLTHAVTTGLVIGVQAVAPAPTHDFP